MLLKLISWLIKPRQFLYQGKRVAEFIDISSPLHMTRYLFNIIGYALSTTKSYSDKVPSIREI